jgi:hypothetical protein
MTAISINEIFIIFLCAAAIHPIPDIPDFFTDFLGLLLGQFVLSATSGRSGISKILRKQTLNDQAHPTKTA